MFRLALKFVTLLREYHFKVSLNFIQRLFSIEILEYLATEVAVFELMPISTDVE